MRARGVAVRAAGWGWKHAGRDLPAISGLDLDIPPGQRVLLAGASGAGKSTLLHALAGVLHADEETEAHGELLLDEVPAHMVHGRAGLMQQDPETQVIQARIGDDVAFGAENLAVDPAEIRIRVKAALEAVGLRLSLDHPTAALSGGQKQRLALAGILAMGPGLVLLDEPTANLDPEGVLEVRDAVIAAVAASGATLLIVEHRLDAWAPHMDRVIVLRPGGGIAIDGTPDELFGPGPQREELIADGIWVPGHMPATARTRGIRAGTSTRALLETTDLAVARTAKGQVLQRDIGLQLSGGQALCVTGPNGAGKSTLALTLAGLLPEREGSVAALDSLRGSGSSLSHRPYSWRASHLVSRIGTVFQEPEHQFVANSVREELAFGPRMARTPDGRSALFTEEQIHERVGTLLERLRLEHLAAVNPFTLSGGEKRRLSVATVLAAGPAVLILDEPTFGQDANTWAELAGLLNEHLDTGGSVLAVTHDEHFAAALGAERLELSEGMPSKNLTGTGGLLEPEASSSGSFLGRANPLAKLAAVILATAPLVASLDWVSGAVVVLASLFLLPLSGLSPVRFMFRAWPLLVAGMLAAWGTALVGNDSGALLLNLGIFTITEGSVSAGVATGLRAFAVAIPSVLVFSSTDPTDLANALAQKARLPHRFVLGALAGMRLLGLLTEEWRTLGMARRARGVGAHGTVAQRLRANLWQGLGLLVQAIRRAARLAVTMEAKGFGTSTRTWSKTSRFAPKDAGVLMGGLAIGAAATAAAMGFGTWNLVWG
nr:ATP-binding cassette domain-containing protein [Paeniglutamicibacter cryotolerans]